MVSCMDVEATLIEKAAQVWERLCGFQYHFVYGRKGVTHDILLTFSLEDFPHLAGFQYLRDISSIPRSTPKKAVERILKGTITQQMIEQGVDYEKLVKPRLLALTALEETLDNEFRLYTFVPRFYSFYTNIRADYLVTSNQSPISFVFLVQDRDVEKSAPQEIKHHCLCCSAFYEGERDYTQNQRTCYLLRKEKINIQSGETNTLYEREKSP